MIRCHMEIRLNTMFSRDVGKRPTPLRSSASFEYTVLSNVSIFELLAKQAGEPTRHNARIRQDI